MQRLIVLQERDISQNEAVLNEIRSTPFQGGPFWGRLKTAFRSFAPPFQLEPAALGFELVFGA